MDPRPGIQAIEDAYALAAAPVGTFLSFQQIAPIDDVVLGTDEDGIERPYGIVRAGRISFRGTIMPSGDLLTRLVEWHADARAELVQTPWGGMAAGTYRIFETLRTSSGKPLSAYRGGVDGHSLGALIACAVAADFQVPLCAWACPRGLGDDFVRHLQICPTRFYRELLDVVWHLGFGVLPPAPVMLTAEGLGDLAYHHAMTTYAASFQAQSLS